MSVRLVWRPQNRPEWLKHGATSPVLLNVLDAQLIIGEVPLSSGWNFDSLPLKTSPTGNSESNFQVHLLSSNGTRCYEAFESAVARLEAKLLLPQTGEMSLSAAHPCLFLLKLRFSSARHNLITAHVSCQAGSRGGRGRAGQMAHFHDVPLMCVSFWHQRSFPPPSSSSWQPSAVTAGMCGKKKMSAKRSKIKGEETIKSITGCLWHFLMV